MATASTSTSTSTSTPIITTTTAIIPDEDVEQRKRVAAAHYRQGNHHYLAGDYSHAIESYTCALEHWPNDSSTWNNRGMSYIAKQLIRTGIRDYNQAIALSPNIADLYYKRGVAYSLLRHYSASIEDYTHCLTLQPTHCDALNNRGNALKQLGYLQQSHADLTNAHHLQPDNAMYTMNLKKIEIVIQQSLSSDSSYDTASQRAHAIISHLQSLASQIDTTPEQMQADAQVADAIQKSKENDEKQRYDEIQHITSIHQHSSSKHTRINGAIGVVTEEEDEVPIRKRQRHIPHETSTSSTIRPIHVFPSENDDSYMSHSASLV